VPDNIATEGELSRFQIVPRLGRLKEYSVSFIHRNMSATCFFSIAAALALASTTVHAQMVVYSNNFEAPLPATFVPGVAELAGVQGYAGLGHPGNQFGGSFLRSPTGNVITLTLTGLPPHTAINLDFLFAAIDSLDGTGTYPQGDFFRVTLDGAQLFRESFANATPNQIQSYSPPTGGTLARHVNLGFTGPGSYYTDSAYDMTLEPAFHHLTHSAATATFTFQIEGPGIQSLGDESWAMDNLRVSIEGGCGCVADMDNGDGAGQCDGGVGIEDLLYYLDVYDAGTSRADVDDGTGTGTHDGGVGIEDLLYYLERYDAGC
jgi:hypothetical protein